MAKRRRLTPPEPRAAEPLETKARTPFGPAPIAQVAGDAAARAALDAVAGEIRTARAEGRLLQALPLEAVEAGHLVRDRIAPDPADEEMAALVASLRARGQQMPVEVVELAPEGEVPRYGLISGWRRVMALRHLAAEGWGDGTVLARIRAPEGAPEAYLAMVEENEIRAGLSHYERARIVVRAVEAGVFPDRTAALRSLFANVSRAKRSKIRAFAEIVDALDEVLTYPTRIGERLGLLMAQALAARPTLAPRIGTVLRDAPPADAEAEQRAILKVIDWRPPAAETPKAAAPERHVRRVGGVRLVHEPGRARVTLEGVAPDLAEALAAWLAGR